MQTNKITDTNFKGGFRFRQMPSSAKKDLTEFITTKKQIFNNFENIGDVFLVTRDKTNFKVAQFIRKHNLKFEFYPTINTKCGLDAEMPEKLTQLISSIKEAPITTKSKLKKALDNQRKTEFIEYKSPKYVDIILKSLCIDNKHPITEYKGGKIITDNEFNRKIFISPPSKLNIHYVMVKSNDRYGEVLRYAIDSQGNMLARFKSPDAIKIFNKRFSSLLVK